MTRLKPRRATEVSTDAGPLTALLDRKDPNHARVLAGIALLPEVPLLTTCPV